MLTVRAVLVTRALEPASWLKSEALATYMRTVPLIYVLGIYASLCQLVVYAQQVQIALVETVLAMSVQPTQSEALAK